ncbi:MAG TPA: Hpt domain-containing protein [Thermoanaerobaculia bacterium]|nr:Hpt domain-containing protein [Thermoanaerobaculia bacterium]
MEPLEAGSLSPLDHAAIAELISLDESLPGFVRELIDIYYVEGRKRLQLLDEAATSHDLGSAASAAHALRGCSANIGAIDVARSCGALEEAARAGARIDLENAVAAIHSAYQAALPWLASVATERQIS